MLHHYMRGTGEVIFDDEQLCEELRHPDHNRRRSALIAVYAISELVALRARANGTSEAREQPGAYDWDRLSDELVAPDDATFVAAFRVFDELAYLAALRAGQDEHVADAARKVLRELVWFARTATHAAVE